MHRCTDENDIHLIVLDATYFVDQAKKNYLD